MEGIWCRPPWAFQFFSHRSRRIDSVGAPSSQRLIAEFGMDAPLRHLLEWCRQCINCCLWQLHLLRCCWLCQLLFTALAVSGSYIFVAFAGCASYNLQLLLSLAVTSLLLLLAGPVTTCRVCCRLKLIAEIGMDVLAIFIMLTFYADWA